MDDRAALFVILASQACDTARLARLPVRLFLQDGTQVRGQPALAADEASAGGDRVGIGGRVVALAEVVEISVVRPSG